jgi:hypothetical protein
MGCEVHALDIVPEALARVHDCATTHLSADELAPASIDLALSHWVAPHMSADALAAQIAAVVKALRPGRLFALHYNEPDGKDPREPLDPVGWPAREFHSHGRRLEVELFQNSQIHFSVTHLNLRQVRKVTRAAPDPIGSTSYLHETLLNWER